VESVQTIQPSVMDAFPLCIWIVTLLNAAWNVGLSIVVFVKIFLVRSCKNLSQTIDLNVLTAITLRACAGVGLLELKRG